MQLTTKQWTKGILAFWSWNDSLQEQEIVKQVRSFREAGLSGFFIHARGGLATPYLGEDWMNAVDCALQEAKRLDLEVWLYDEDAWPSGFCGGTVPQGGVEHQQKWLAWERCKGGDLVLTACTIAVYRRRGADWELCSITAQPGGEEEYLHVFYQVNRYYSDLMNEATVQRFIASTHEQYKARFGHEFGQAIKGIFTDEPQYSVDQFPWTMGFLDQFRSRYGYELAPLLPLLLLGDDTAIRHDYWKLVSRLMVDSYMKQVGLWCERNGLALTGHVAGEDTLLYQMRHTAGAMPYYEWMHMPGVDHLGRRLTRPVFLKQAASAAAQLGRGQVLSEMFGCSGWTTNFADMKWIAEWHLSLGVNVQCQHLAAYSLRGARKKDYPPAISYQQPWWSSFHPYNAYFEQLYSWTSQGDCVPKVLVLHPLSSAWCSYHPEQPDALWELDRRLGDLTELLLRMGIAFDYGDESLMERHGSVQGGTLRIGEATYGMVVAPALISVERATYQLVKGFVEGGGTLLQFGEAPVCLDGRANGELGEWWRANARRLMPTEKTIQAFMGHMQAVALADPLGYALKDVFAQVRIVGAGKRLFLANASRMEAREGVASIPGHWCLTMYDPRTNAEEACAYWHANERTYWSLKLEGGESACVEAMPLGDAPPTLQPRLHAPELASSYALSRSWELAEMPDNMLVLDMASYATGNDSRWSPAMPIHAIQEWLQEQGEDGEVRLQFGFHIQAGTDCSAIRVAVENWDGLRLLVNGYEVACEDPGVWLDPCLSVIPIGTYLLPGDNLLELVSMFHCTRAAAYLEDKRAFETERNRYVPVTELEPVYVLGAFAVQPAPGYKLEAIPGSHRLAAESFSLVPLPAQVDIADLTVQGFWFFSGHMVVRQRFQAAIAPCRKYVLKLPVLPDAALVEVRINGTLAEQLLWSPYAVDITAYLQEGSNEIELTLTAGLRNTFGPHHYYRGEAKFVGPSMFRGAKGWEDLVLGYRTPEETWSPGYHFVSFGLQSAPVLMEYADSCNLPKSK